MITNYQYDRLKARLSKDNIHYHEIGRTLESLCGRSKSYVARRLLEISSLHHSSALWMRVCNGIRVEIDPLKHNEVDSVSSIISRYAKEIGSVIVINNELQHLILCHEKQRTAPVCASEFNMFEREERVSVIDQLRNDLIGRSTEFLTGTSALFSQLSTAPTELERQIFDNAISTIEARARTSELWQALLKSIHANTPTTTRELATITRLAHNSHKQKPFKEPEYS